jgi:lactate dehydrogenase-like 2-hydroxyacid dehydrogenase
MEPKKPRIAVYDTKPCDREYLGKAAGVENLDLRSHDFRLAPETAFAADGARAVCVSVNDQVRRPTLQSLAERGVGMVALRCAGLNNVELEVAKELGIAVSRVPSYSPRAVAEHTVALILTPTEKRIVPPAGFVNSTSRSTVWRDSTGMRRSRKLWERARSGAFGRNSQSVSAESLCLKNGSPFSSRTA